MSADPADFPAIRAHHAASRLRWFRAHLDEAARKLGVVIGHDDASVPMQIIMMAMETATAAAADSGRTLGQIEGADEARAAIKAYGEKP